MLSSGLCNALLSVVILLSAHALADEDDSVTFGLSDCVSRCVATTGYSTEGEDNQKIICTATRDALLEAVMACMVEQCSDGLSNVASDLLEPMETACKELEMPITVEDIQEAASAAASFEATAVFTSFINTTSSTSTEVSQAISTTTIQILISTTPGPDTQTSLFGSTTTLNPVVLVTTMPQATTTPEQPLQVITSAAEPNTTSVVFIVPAEQPTSVSSAESTLEMTTTATETTSIPTSSALSTPSALTTNRSSLVQQESTTTRVTRMVIPSTIVGGISSVHPDATKKGEAKSTTAPTENTTKAIKTDASKAEDATTQATTIRPSASGPEGLSRAATPASDAGSALEVATGSPAATTTTSGFATSTSPRPSTAMGSKTGGSSSPEATGDVDTGDPFSIVTDSAAAPGGRLSLMFSAVAVAVAVLTSVW